MIVTNRPFQIARHGVRCKCRRAAMLAIGCWLSIGWGAVGWRCSAATSSLIEELRQLHQQERQEQLHAPFTTTNVQSLRREILLDAARNAAVANKQVLAQHRFEMLLAEFPDDLETRYELAGRQIQWARWPAAQRQLEQLVSARPREFRFRESLADVLIQQEQWVAATGVLDAGLQFSDLPPAAAIKLARLLAWQSDYGRAAEILRLHVPSHLELEPKVRKQLAKCWIEMRQSAPAVELLTQLLEQRPNDPSLLAIRIRAQADLDDRIAVAAGIDQLSAYNDREGSWRLELADTLYREGHDRPALEVYRQHFKRKSDDYVVGAKIVRAQLRLFDVVGAEQTLATLAPFRDRRVVQQAEANYFVVSGQHADAARIYGELLAAEPNDVDIRNGLGHLYYSIGDFLRAESEYRKALALSPSSLKTIRYVARAQILSWQFDAAIRLLRAESSTKPRRLALCMSLVEALFQAGHYEEAEKECQWGIAQTNDPRMRAALKTEIGWTRLKQGQSDVAVAIFRGLQSQPGGDTPKVAYGLYRALTGLGRTSAAQRSLAAALDRWPATLLERLILADLATAECCCDFACEILQPCYREQPDNMFLAIRLGEAASQCDRRRGTHRDRGYFRHVLRQSPHNTRARLGIARSYARTRCHQNACGAYQNIIKELPAHRLAESELSRVTYGAWGVDAGVSKFCRAQHHMARAREAIPPPEVIPATQRVDATETVEPGEIDQEVALLHCESTAYEQSLLSLERQAKLWKSWRPRTAIVKYQQLLALDQINEEAHFDLAQVHGQMNATWEAVSYFNRLLAVNPCHTEAAVARSRAELEMGRQSHSRVSLFDQRGRDGLASIRRLRLETIGQSPLGDEDEFLHAGYAHQFLTTADGNHVAGDIGLLGAAWKPGDYTKLFTDLEIASYDEGLATRPLFRIGMQRRTPGDVTWQCAGFLENVLENSESLAQDIHRVGVVVDARRALSWRWSLGGAYRWARYSDDNTLNEFSVSSSYLHWYGSGRRKLRSIVDFNFIDYREGTQFGPVQGNLSGTLHPYFAPQSFGNFSAGGEWKEWLSRDNFKYANQWWYSVYGGGRVDTEAVGYGLLRARCHRDLRNWLSYGVESTFLFSKVYKSVGVSAYLTLRFD